MPTPIEGRADGGVDELRREPSYGRQSVAFVLEFDSRGQYRAVQPLGRTAVYGYKTLVVPRPIRRRPHGGPNFLCDVPRFALGLRISDTKTAVRADCDAFAAFRDLHLDVLKVTADPAACAFLRFVEAWDPQAALRLPGLDQLKPRNLVFRFQYDDVFLHERHAVRLAWRRRAACDPAAASSLIETKAGGARKNVILGQTPGLAT